jgi:hypothetical protein
MVMAQGFSKEQVESILSDVAGGDLIDEPTRAVLLLAEKATKNPHQVTSEDIQVLRGQGLSDEAILEAIHVAAFFNYLDRMADCTGAPVEGMVDMVAGMQAAMAEIRGQIVGALAGASFPLTTPEELVAAFPNGAETVCQAGEIKMTAGQAGQLLSLGDFPFTSPEQVAEAILSRVKP